MSSIRKITIGVPQEIILGPILFLIFVNDFPNSSDILLPTLFTDDTTLSISNDNYEELVHALNHELNLAKNWTISNRLSIIVEKTEMILISSRITNHSNNQIILDDDFIKFNDMCICVGYVYV